MTDELEQKLREVEAAAQFYRRRLLSSEVLRHILLNLYTLLESEEAEKKVKEKKENEEALTL